MSAAVISVQTAKALARVMDFFGIDAYNKPLFGEAARDAGTDAFARTIEALAAACERDSRCDINLRIKDRIAREKELKRIETARQAAQQRKGGQ